MDKKTAIDQDQFKIRVEQVRAYFSEQDNYQEVDQLLEEHFDNTTEFGNHNRPMLKEKLNKKGLSLCWLLYGKGEMLYKK